MDSYTGFANLYDLFMDNIDYDTWCEYLHSLLLEYQIPNGIVLELGCGTGTVCEHLAKRGYDMIGIDNSYEMLDVAMQKKAESELDILYLQQDMREFELYGTVAAIVSICDSMNYITEYEDFVEVLKLANNYLDPQGIFIFDLNTETKFLNISNQTIAENREEGSFIWENTYYPDEHINEYDLTIFEACEDGRYDKYEEVHYERAYSLEEVKKAISEAGMQFVAAYDAFTHNPPTEESERIYIIAREQGK